MVVQKAVGSQSAAAARTALASQIVASLDRQGLTVREAGVRTGTAAADFSRLRQGNLERFTIDRLLQIASRLGEQVRIAVEVVPGASQPQAPPPLIPHLKRIRALCKRYGVRRLSAFGSVVRPDFRPSGSDVDLAVEFGKARPMGPANQYFRFKEALEDLLGRSVDLVELAAMTGSRLKRAIEREQVSVYEQAA